MMGIEGDQKFVEAISTFVVLLCASILISHLLAKCRWINSTIIGLLIGLGAGITILYVSKRTSLLKFSDRMFFTCLLPPIICNAGFQVKKKQFFHNFSAITLYGTVGTLISFVVVTLGAVGLFHALGIDDLSMKDYLAIGAIFAATDSVSTLQVLNQDETPSVYSLVFGESVVNDATTMVLFNVIQRCQLSDTGSSVVLDFTQQALYLFIASTLFGAFIGLLCSYLTKKLYFAAHSTDREIAVILLMAYLSYMLAEVCHLSGILSVFFCGIVMSHYAWHNVTESSRITVKHSFATMSFIAENFIFVYVGMDALDVERLNFIRNSAGTSFAVSSALLGLVLVGRAAAIFPLSFLVNLTRTDPEEKIGFKQQVIIWWAGLMRGSVSMALVYIQFVRSGQPVQLGNAIVITSTSTNIFVTNIGLGMLTKPLLRRLLSSATFSSSETSSLKSMTLPLLSNLRDSDGSMAQIIGRKSTLTMLMTRPKSTIHYHWRIFDNAYMRPLFGSPDDIINQNADDVRKP